MLHFNPYCTFKLLLTHKAHRKHNGLHCHKCLRTQGGWVTKDKISEIEPNKVE